MFTSQERPPREPDETYVRHRYEPGKWLPPAVGTTAIALAAAGLGPPPRHHRSHVSFKRRQAVTRFVAVR